MSDDSSVQRLSICLSKWVVEGYLNNQHNKSRFIEQMILTGLEVDEDKLPTFKQQILKQNSEIAELREQNKRLKFQLDGWKARKGKAPMSEDYKEVEAIRRAGLMSLRTRKEK